MMERLTWSCDSLRAGLNDLRKFFFSKVIWACPQVTWSMLIWRSRIMQFFPLASSLHFLPPLLTLWPMAEATPANHQWLSATAAVGAWDAGASWAQVSSFFFSIFFLALLMIFLQLDYVCMNYDGDNEHMPSPNTEINRGLRCITWAPRYVFFFFKMLFFTHVTMTYS